MPYPLFVGLAPFVLAALAWAGGVAWRRRMVPGARWLAFVCAAGAAWLLCALAEALAPTEAASAWAGRLAYLAIGWVPFGWLSFALAFAGRPAGWRSPLAATVGAVAAVTAGLAPAMPWHGLIWATATPVLTGPFRDNAVAYGPWFWVLAGTAWTAVSVGSFLLAHEFARSARTYRRLSAWLAVGALAPVAVNVFAVLRLLPEGKDPTPISLGLSVAAIAWGVFRYRLLDLHPTARAVVLELMSDALAVVDPAGRVTDFNAALRRLAGPGLDLGVPFAEALPPLAEALRTASGETELRVDGVGRTFEWRAAAEEGTRGRLVLLRDVTERRAAETALRTALVELQARNDDLDAFAHTVAHDLKNPIHVVRGYAELLADEGDGLLPELRDESVQTILRTADTMNGIVQELLLLASVRHERVASVPLDMGGVVSGVLERLGPLVREAGARVEVMRPWPGALGHAPWVAQVWTNYLSNAVKYGGRPPHIRLGADAPRGGEPARFWVEDNGAGLAPEDAARVFAPFTRFDEEQAEGHGLGLSVVVRVLDKLGGAYGVERPPSGGSRFWFSLPAAPLVAPPAFAPAPSLSASSPALLPVHAAPL